MSTLHAILIATLQGATELFPISSLGHAVVLPALLGWPIDQRAPEFLPFLVLLHTGTAAALLLYFWRDWLGLAHGVLGLAGTPATQEARRLFLLIVVATIPAVVLGGLLTHFFERLFASPLFACGFLVLNGLLLLFGERLRANEPAQSRPLASMTTRDAVAIGVWQCGALFPGISRSGATIVGGLLRGFNHVDSARFSFLIALPIILGATVLKLPLLLRSSVPASTLNLAVAAAVVAGVVAWLATAILMRYFRSNDDWALTPFAVYCLAFGAGAGLYFGLR